MKKRSLYALLSPLMAVAVMAASGAAALSTMTARAIPAMLQLAAPVGVPAVMFGAAALAPAPADAGPNGCAGLSDLVTMGFEQIAVSTTAVPFTSSVYAPTGQPPAVMAIVTVETANMRFRDDGVAPTGNVGVRVLVGAVVNVCGTSVIRNNRWIRQQATDGTIDVQYYRVGN